MKIEKEKIDYLLEQNTNEQLACVDWGKLNTAISQKLDNANQDKVPAVRHRALFKATAGLAAAAVVVVAIMLSTETSKTTQTISDGKATVSFINNKGSATVETKQKKFANATVVVEIGGLNEKKNTARCDIEIIKTDQDTQKQDERATWIIIRVPEPVLVDNGNSKDQADLACLL